MRNSLILFGFLFLAGCDHFDNDKDYVTKQTEDDADQMADNVESSAVSVADVAKENVKKTGDQFRSWLISPRPPKPADHSIPASYCYRTQADIICYRQAMAGWETRLVAYQGTGATPPIPAQTIPLAKAAVDLSLTPEKKVANAKPVFAELPPPPKEEEKNTDQAPTFDATHEQLPNPTHSPQM